MAKQKPPPIQLGGLERLLLKEYVHASPLALVHRKTQAVLLADKAVAAEDIADLVDRQEDTIIRWLRARRTHRLSSIFTGHQDNRNAGKLNRNQLEEIRQTLQSPPSDFGLPKAFWEVPQLKQYIAATFGVVYESDTSYHYLLKKTHIPHKPKWIKNALILQ